MVGVLAFGAMCVMASPASASRVYYHGDEVQNNPHVYLIFWGKDWNEYSSVRTEIQEMFAELSGSTWQNILTQYYDHSGFISTELHVDSWNDETVSAPSGVNEEHLEEEVEFAQSQRGWPATGIDNFFYVLPVPESSKYETGFVQGCGSHRYSSRLGVTFGYDGWPTSLAKGDCLKYSTDSKEQLGPAMTVSASHEYAEAATDPKGYRYLSHYTGWATIDQTPEKSNHEIADLCSPNNGHPSGQLPNGTWVTALWDNSKEECVLSRSEANQNPVHVVIPPGDDNFPGPHAIVQKNGTVDTFYRTPSGELGHDWYDTGGSGWHSGNLAGSVASAPHAVVQENGTIDVFYRTPSGELGHDWIGSGGGGWSSGNLAGSVASDPHPVVQPNGTIDVFYRTPSGELGHDWYDTGGSGWHSGNLAGSVASNPHPVARANGTVDVFYRTPSGELGHDWIGSGGGGWSSGNLAGSVASDPCPVVQENGTVDVFYRTPSGELGHDWYDTGGSGWHSGNLAEELDASSTPHAVAQPNGTVDVFFATPSGELGHDWYDVGGSWNSGSLAGSLLNPKAPKATSEAATGVKTTEATIHATVNPEGAPTTYQFEYGATTSYGTVVSSSTPELGSGTASLEGSKALSGLSPGATYHFRVVATNEMGTTYGADKTLTTHKPPSATTEAATSAKGGEATLNATVNPNATATTYQFEYGPTTSYGTKIPTSATSAGSGTSDVKESQTPTGLTQGTTYHYRIVAINANEEISYGSDKTLTTLKVPKVTTEASSFAHATTAEFGGKVNPEGSATTYWYEYGSTTSLGEKTPSFSAGSGTSYVEAGKTLSNLTPETTYYYALVASSYAGEASGEVKTLTTTPPLQSPAWFVGGELLKEEEKVPFESAGELAWSIGPWIVAGPCPVTGHGYIYNYEGEGHAEFTGYAISTPCATNFPGCHLASSTNNTEEEASWPFEMEWFEEGNINIEKISVTNHFEGCGLVGLSTVQWGGTLHGWWNNEIGGLEYQHTGALQIPTESPISITTYGVEYFTTEGGAITLSY